VTTRSAIFGDTSNLKASQAKALARLHERQVPADQVISAALARDLLDLSHELGRQLGLFIDRRGRVESVILGDAHSMELPEFARVRGAGGRLRGVRLVATHLVTDPLTREELADLAKLRLDLVAAIHRGPAGIQLDAATLAPPEPGSRDIFSVRTWTRTPLSLLTRDLGPDEALPAAAPQPFTAFVRDLEAQLVAATSRARAESTGTRAMILMVHRGGPDVEAREHELRELCRTLGIDVIDVIQQRRPRPDPRTFLGSGKLRDVLVQALEHDVELLICDPELTPSQARSISDQTDLKVIDRTMLILDIFAQHAKSSDGKLQVELAQLRYRMPFMVGKGTMMSRLAGGIGGRGPGETKLEIDRRRAKDRQADLEKRLKKMRKQRDQRRSQRRRSQVPIVAIVGYTNAGKSTLLNTITGADVIAENKLFATLDPTVRRIRFPEDREVVLLDTVGFIRELPPALMQAFSATLEEVAEADLLLMVADVSDEDRDQHVATVERILGDLGAGEVPRLMVLNKCDLLAETELTREQEIAGANTYFVSALDRRSTRPLIEAIENHLWERGRVERPIYAAARHREAEAELESDAESEAGTEAS
jgi:GTP-binding protein HflX